MEDDQIAEAVDSPQTAGTTQRPFGYVLTNLNYYSPGEWAQIKTRQHRTWAGIPVIRVSDEAGRSTGADPVAVLQYAIGIGVAVAILAILVTIAVLIH